MNPLSLREELRDRLLSVGCSAVGFARAEPVSDDYAATLRQWLAEGRYASMQYMPLREELRFDPRKILSDAATVISVGIAYLSTLKRAENAPQVALYACGKDYHKQIVKMLRPVCRYIENTFQASTRICVDSAPVAERYWAVKSGIAFRGRNGTVIHPRYGSYIFLAEILTSLSLPADKPIGESCIGCDACRRACPGEAILADGTIDARRCLSYLTIEHRGQFSDEQRAILNTEQGRNTIYGCDICQRVCPHNRDAQTSTVKAFAPTELWLTLDWEFLKSVTPDEWEKLTRGTALRRADLATLRRQ